MPRLLYATLFLLLAGYSGCSADCGSTSVQPGYQAIVLGAPFRDTGNITSFNTTAYFMDSVVSHAIFLQIWRPINGSTFQAVAQQYFFMDPVVTSQSNYISLPLHNKFQVPINLSFIPKDVLGYYVITDAYLNPPHTSANSISPYMVNSLNESSSVDVHVINSTASLKSFSISGPASYSKMQLLITMVYTITSPSSSTGGKPVTTTLGVCPQVTSTPTPALSSSVPSAYQSAITLQTTPTSLSSPSFSSPSPPSSSSPSPFFSSPSSSTTSVQPSLPLHTTGSPTPFPVTITAVTASIGALCIFLLFSIIAAIVFILRRRPSVLANYTNGKRVSTEIMHYESKQGEVYTLPNKQKEVVTRHNSDKFNIDSYASSYEVNGNMHMYQEPSDMITSPLYQQISAQDAVDASIVRLTTSYQPPTLVGGVGPHMLETGLLSSNCSLNLSPNPHAPAPLPPPRSRTLSTSTHKSSMPQNPIATLRPLPPRPPSHELPAPVEYQKPNTEVNSLFAKMDEQNFHVPSSYERKILKDTSDQDKDIYSRLAHPRPMDPNNHSSTFFEQNDVFWDPPSSSAELYDVLSKRKYREIHRCNLSITSVLGSGNFGTVCKGVWTFSGGQLKVAIKMLRDDASEEEKVKLLQEAAIMGQFSHPNVVKMYGVVTIDDPLLLILELIPNGDLRNFVLKYRKKKSTHHPSPIPIPTNLPKTFVSFARDIACGMVYLSKKNFVHRDLAARNIFLTEDLRCKIGDFGMARDLTQSYECIYQSQGGVIPLKWSAPEAIEHRQYNTSSDVWSFGMVLFEVWSLGHKPFGSVTPEKMADLVTTGYCQPPPPGCPRAIYELMVKCWNPKADGRPSFSDLYQQLGKPVEELLAWSPEDRECGEQVSELGAPMTCSRNLYPDLQHVYTDSTYV